MSFITAFKKRLANRRLITQVREEDIRRQTAMHTEMSRLLASDDIEKSAEIAAGLYAAWGDELDETRQRFLRSCLKQVESREGNVLLSSASLLTVVLGALTVGDKTRTIWCLEHDRHWINVVRSWLAQYAISGAYLVHSPIAVIGGMVRYQILTRHLPKNISVVICERSGAAPGAALSMLVAITPHLAEDFTVFARHVDLGAEAGLIRRWASKHNANFVVVDSNDGFIKLVRQAGVAAQNGPARFDALDVPMLEETPALEAESKTAETQAA